MKKILVTVAFMFFLTPTAFAGGSHQGGFGKGAAFASTTPGMRMEISRTTNILMRETDEGDLVFEPRAISIEKGETIRFVIRNSGEIRHEFYLDDHAGVMAHKFLTERSPASRHDGPNSLHVEPGKRGEIIWMFPASGRYEFACLVPGHFADGMRGTITVVETSG